MALLPLCIGFFANIPSGADIKRGRRSLIQLRRGSFVAKKSSSQAWTAEGFEDRVPLYYAGRALQVSLTEYQKRVQDAALQPNAGSATEFSGSSTVCLIFVGNCLDLYIHTYVHTYIHTYAYIHDPT